MTRKAGELFVSVGLVVVIGFSRTLMERSFCAPAVAAKRKNCGLRDSPGEVGLGVGGLRLVDRTLAQGWWQRNPHWDRSHAWRDGGPTGQQAAIKFLEVLDPGQRPGVAGSNFE